MGGGLVFLGVGLVLGGGLVCLGVGLVWTVGASETKWSGVEEVLVCVCMRVSE